MGVQLQAVVQDGNLELGDVLAHISNKITLLKDQSHLFL